MISTGSVLQKQILKNNPGIPFTAYLDGCKTAAEITAELSRASKGGDKARIRHEDLPTGYNPEDYGFALADSYPINALAEAIAKDCKGKTTPRTASQNNYQPEGKYDFEIEETMCNDKTHSSHAEAGTPASPAASKPAVKKQPAPIPPGVKGSENNEEELCGRP